MRAVTEGAVTCFSAGAIPVGAWSELEADGLIRCGDWLFRHLEVTLRALLPRLPCRKVFR